MTTISALDAYIKEQASNGTSITSEEFEKKLIERLDRRFGTNKSVTNLQVEES